MIEEKTQRSWKPFRISVVVALVLLSIQGWTGDYVNVFVTTGKNSVAESIPGFFSAVTSSGPFLLWHAAEGFLILLLSVAVLLISLQYERRSVKIAALLGLGFVVSAGLGGFLFVLSGFTAGGSSMQMGGSFIGAYALYFIALWYTK